MPKSPDAKARQAEYLRSYRERYRTMRKRVNVTFTLEEYARLAEAAEAAGESETTFLHRVAVATLTDRPALSKADEERFGEFMRTVRGIGNNLNQMARYSNSMREMLDEREVGYQLQYLEETVRRFLSSGGDGK